MAVVGSGRSSVEEQFLTKRLAAALNASFLEIPISYSRRTFNEGKKIGLRDGFRALYVITKYGITV